MLAVAENLPETSEFVPLISKFCCMNICALSLVQFATPATPSKRKPVFSFFF
jgi:hypothetical protein